MGLQQIWIHSQDLHELRSSNLRLIIVPCLSGQDELRQGVAGHSR